MLAASLFRNEQETHEINRAIIDGVKIDRPLQPGKQAKKMIQAGNASVRQGDSLANTSRPQHFPRAQRLENCLVPNTHLLCSAPGQFAQ